MIHANRAKEIADKFDPVSDRETRLAKTKAEISEKILEAARTGKYHVHVAIEADIAGDMCGYLCGDCGYLVTQTFPHSCFKISWT